VALNFFNLRQKIERKGKGKSVILFRKNLKVARIILKVFKKNWMRPESGQTKNQPKKKLLTRNNHLQHVTVTNSNDDHTECWPSLGSLPNSHAPES
jgi:hypothetical protein